ncbi:MAG TPA: HAD family hydrolase [Terriglobia bacterium]|nr:HAD family hydrolase [Terriglobia bacterium]
MKVLLFDLDDTLIDYSGGVERCWEEACAVHCPSAGVDADRLVRALADTRRWFWNDPERHRRERVNMPQAWRRIAEYALASVGAPDDDGFAARLAGEYASRRRETLDLFPESLSTLDHFRARGVSLGLVTNGDASQQRDKIERFGLAGYFDVMVIEGEFGAGKPDAIVYRHALETLGADPSVAAMVGDHLEFDVAGSQRCGITGVWIDRRGRGLGLSAVRPHRIVSSLTELTETT